MQSGPGIKGEYGGRERIEGKDPIGSVTDGNSRNLVPVERGKRGSHHRNANDGNSSLERILDNRSRDEPAGS